MIARHWRGRVRAADADAYVGYVRDTGVAAQRATPGNRGSMILVRTEGREAEVVVLSLWDSLETVEAFAGSDPEEAVFYPEDDRYLVDRETRVRHYDVSVLAIGAPIAAGNAIGGGAAIPLASYFDGRVQSLRFREAAGEATVGVITPGTYQFSTDAGERVTILSGTLDVVHAGVVTSYRADETYVIPPGEYFEVRAAAPVAYVCRFVGGTQR